MAIVRICLVIFIVFTVLALTQSPFQTIGMWGKTIVFLLALAILGWIVYAIGGFKKY